jgi:hypothetical protein
MSNVLKFGQVKLDELNVPPPDYIFLPKSGTPCPRSSLTRSALDLLTRPQSANNFRPPVKSKIFKQTGEKVGRRLIDYRSLRKYLDNLPDGGARENIVPRGKWAK